MPTRASQRYSRDCCLAHSITDYTEIMRASHTTIASRVRGHAFGMLVIAEADAAAIGQLRNCDGSRAQGRSFFWKITWTSHTSRHSRLSPVR